MTRFILLLSALVLAAGGLHSGAALAEWDVDGIEQLLPQHETAEERLRWLGREDQMPRRDKAADPAPLAPVRNCAEWEPATGVLIRYPLGLPYALLRDFDDDVTLHVVVSSGNYDAAVTNLTNNGVDMGNVEFLVKNSDSIWTRDYGPWFVFDGDDVLTIVDHVYNRPSRPNDNLIPIYFGEQQGIPVVSHDMWHTGGNYMTDGAHISSSTALVYNEAASENGMSPAEVDQLMLDYYGVEDYIVLDYIEGGGIHHIDTWAKFLDEETVLVKDVWSTHGTYNNLNQRAALLASLEASTGRNYQVYRVYCYNIGGGAPASYTNSLFLNNTIYVPTFGNATYDNDALAVYEEAAPGYSVQGYSYGGWLSDDALHCRAMGIMDRDMLRVAHVPVLEDQIGGVTVSAEIVDHSGEGLVSAEVLYRHGGGGWNALSMSNVGGDAYETTIPEPGSATTAEYYIHAVSLSGREEGMPRTEPAAWYSFSHEPAGSGIGDVAGTGDAILHGNFPNPARHETTFRFELLHPDHVELVVYDAQGRVVRRLIDEERPAGVTAVDWDGRDGSGRRLGSGVYHYRLRAAGLQYSRPLVLMK
jgi:agmatine/peptidylarginine deiminase